MLRRSGEAHPTYLESDMTISVFIVPALTDMAGQCRIVARSGEVSSARDDYRANPQAWREIGLMNSHGRLVCLDADNLVVIDELKACEPLAAGLQLKVDDLETLIS
jgi:hypothetical protein